MQWDLLEEHNVAYEEEICKKINELTDLFDIILDEINLYPNMLCVDVFPCIEHLDIEIPRLIKSYYQRFSEEEYSVKNKFFTRKFVPVAQSLHCMAKGMVISVKNKFDFILSLEKREQTSVYEVLNNIFYEISLSKTYTLEIEKQNKNIFKVADILSKKTGTTFAESFNISKHDLNILQEVYIGILFSGWILRCGDYAILILLGTNE